MDELTAAFEKYFYENDLRKTISIRMGGRQRLVISEILFVCRIVGFHMFKVGVQYANQKRAPVNTLKLVDASGTEIESKAEVPPATPPNETA